MAALTVLLQSHVASYPQYSYTVFSDGSMKWTETATAQETPIPDYVLTAAEPEIRANVAAATATPVQPASNTGMMVAIGIALGLALLLMGRKTK